MVLTLCLIAFCCIFVLMCHIRCHKKPSLICARCGVLVVGSLITLAMYSAGLGALRTVLVFIVSVFIISLLVSLVQPLEIE
ncbi:hypothetical protein NQT69_17065 [Pseudoalteromonas shioyasakiensis]|uniref:hypothetical protein n=1 Tax=Pseudoalteromonas shioyasakiensis TaxID=1190813 RepID=UPI002117856A|nr:hypothetical protein [Pseudoalteromonas shioyasakiensis]MCQ8879713.1 hypothetical protein [Pseudoalteromonas shioyasakiensis]